MKKIISIICLSVMFISTTLLLSGCSVDIDGTQLDGINIVWTPFVWIWHWLWNSFTPGFWAFIKGIWNLPTAISWLAGIVVYLLASFLYIIIVLIIVFVDLILALITGIVWFILAILNGFFHFV